MRNKDQILLENLYDSISNDKFSYPLTVFHGTDIESASDIKQNGLNLSKCDRGYFGKAFYITTDEELAISNYANFSEDEEGGVVLKFEMNPINRVLDLRNSNDWEIYTNLKYKGKEIRNFMGFDEFPSIMTSLGIDALYDRSNDAFAVYNVSILNIKK
jgi:hypothetical protein